MLLFFSVLQSTARNGRLSRQARSFLLKVRTLHLFKLLPIAFTLLSQLPVGLWISETIRSFIYFENPIFVPPLFYRHSEFVHGCWPSFCGIEIHNSEDLLPPGAKPGTVPTDFEQATGLERLELLGKMEGVEIFDFRPLDASRKGAYPPLL